MKMNVYTALMFIACLALGAAVTVVWMKNVELTAHLQQGADFPNPLYIVTDQDLQK